MLPHTLLLLSTLGAALLVPSLCDVDMKMDTLDIEASAKVMPDDAEGDPVPLASMKKGAGKSAEDQIPVIEIKGEGKPMTAAQIRQLEEEISGKQDIKVKHTWRPRECPRAAKRKDFITFHFKGFRENGKKFDQSYGRGDLRIQLGTGMVIPGLDKGLKGICDTELRKIQVPWRLSRRRKSRMWKTIPTDEHWMTFDIEMLTVEEWTPELQFQFFDRNNDSVLTLDEMKEHVESQRKNWGKHWHNEDIDSTIACKYFIKYFDADGDGKVSKTEYLDRMTADMAHMDQLNKSLRPKGRLRDPDVAWVMDFNGDGVVTQKELDDAPEILEQMKPPMKSGQNVKDEL